MASCVWNEPRVRPGAPSLTKSRVGYRQSAGLDSSYPTLRTEHHRAKDGAPIYALFMRSGSEESLYLFLFREFFFPLADGARDDKIGPVDVPGS